MPLGVKAHLIQISEAHDHEVYQTVLYEIFYLPTLCPASLRPPCVYNLIGYLWAKYSLSSLLNRVEAH